MQVSIGRPHMLSSSQRGRGQEPVIVQGRTVLAVTVNMSFYYPSSGLCASFENELPKKSYGVMETRKNCCCIEEMLLVAQMKAPVARTELSTGSHKPELRFVQC